ncbi:Fic family protein [Polynucleobacter sp. MWH-Spelu-300-X4]|jgi:Fic family protein|uniref:Fic family protein n=1 Tax=Polynucleobacter sp. MWH-Spelu-300-X4 TaxID=2689109 RepID=UPI001BFD9202|nr:Fic family protein [Polynucleobacter sp. MWH-Spelu-300-X4]QWD80012.1 Fic family protein [Polynucleobacter sp. MWH-Spelu-300-X4]
MADKITHHYSQIHQFEPLLPQRKLDVLQDQALEVAEKSSRLGGGIHSSTISSIQGLVRSMNSYYSNRIEGQSTHPANIERALVQDFSDMPSTAKLQRIAIAYINAEKELEKIGGLGLENTLRSSILLEAHRALYGRLLPEDRTTEEGRVIEPGLVRQENVTVGRHDPPLWTSVPDFLKRMDQIYAQPASSNQSLIRVACAHQRMMWVHPFLDGNGRAVRLQTHLALLPLTKGLWSMNRGLARQRDDYYAYLAAADQPRQGDLDGRGNLSEKTLWEWCQWFIGIANDQVGFMEKMLNLSEMRRHIEALIFFRASQDKAIRKEAIAPLYHLYLAGPTKRGDFLQMTGLGERTARSLLSRLLETGLVMSDGHKSPVQFAFPLDSLQFLLPNLYPEAAIINH